MGLTVVCEYSNANDSETNIASIPKGFLTWTFKGLLCDLWKVGR